jgi:hypothetical protein
LGKRKIGNGTLAVILIAAVLVGTYSAPYIAGGINQLIAFFSGNNGGNIIDDPNQQFAPQTWTLYKRGTTTAIAGAEVYAWFDWDGNGLVKLGEFQGFDEANQLVGGEIETLSSAATTGVVTTSIEYPVGKFVSYQIHASGYNVETVKRSVISVPPAFDGSALSVQNVYLTAIMAGTSSVAVDGTTLVTDSGDYNYTAGSTSPVCTFRHTPAASDTGLVEVGYTHWGTGKVYAGACVIMTMTEQDFIDLAPDTSYWDKTINLAGTVTMVKFLSALPEFWYDANDDGNGAWEYGFAIGPITAAGDIATIGLYRGILMSSLDAGVIGSALGTYETGLDFVA